MALGTANGDGSLWKLQYEYGELNTDGSVNTAKNTGNIAKQTISFNGLTNPLVQAFKYDSLYRLTEAKEVSGSNQTWKESFNYDRYGNRTGKEKFVGTTQIVNDNKTHPSIDPLTNRFNTGQGYTYDKNGNLVQDADGRGFTFNGENKQAEIKDANNQVIGRYYYDGEGKRVKKVTNTEETVFVYSAGKLVAEYSTAAPPANPTTKWTVTDQLGSPRVIVNSLGNVVSRRDFLPFGEEAINNTGERSSSLKYGEADGVRQKFTGYQKDDETGLDFAEARMYENRHGRFTAVDPLLASGKSANPQTFNRYIYVMNNPITSTDPTGMQTNQTREEVEDRGQVGEVRVYWFDIDSLVQPLPDSFAGIKWKSVLKEYGQYGTVRSLEPQLQFKPSDIIEGGKIGGNNWLASWLNAVPDTDITGIANPFPSAFTFGFNPLNSGITLGDLGLPRIMNYREPENPTQFFSAEATKMTITAGSALLTRKAAGGGNAFRTSTDSAVFYSGKGAASYANEFAKNSGRITMNMTSGGRVINKVTNTEIFGKKVYEIFPKPSEKLVNWGSRKFAENASGRVTFFGGRNRNPNSTWSTVEQPALQQNPRVFTIQG